MISYTRIEGQPLQCVSYVIALHLLYPELGIQNVGGAPVNNAKSLISDKYVSLNGKASTGFGGLLVAGDKLSLEEYEVGDLFVTRNGNFGHVGAIVGKIVEADGNVLLLVTDSNRLIDGRIRLFMADSHSKDFIFGHNYKYIIRRVQNNVSEN